ncbi:MAG: DUF2339 domain-containing protein [Planctomycetota bacterium]|jgi:uncharacterized membrane protein
MYELWVLLIVLAVGCILSGPLALIISIIALNRSKARYREPPERAERVVPERVERVVKAEEAARPAPVPEKSVELAKEEPPAEVVAAAGAEAVKKAKETLFKAAAEAIKEKEKAVVPRKTGTFEERIGTKWILVGGIIAVIFSAGFFLKYAYDNEWIGPLGRVVIAAIGGLFALVLGEVTRRRGYGIVAKGVTALGFVLLYLAVFAAYPYYDLISPTWAYILAILVTAAAMLCAVGLNDLLIAFLSLLGGFLTPVIVSTGENRPMALFSYALILGVGAILCAYYRKWRVVNLLAFLGTFGLYTAWFEKFYWPEMVKGAEGALEQMPKQMPIALGWLGAFFGVYLVLPMLYELVKKVKAHKEDVLLVLANAAVVFYYLWAILAKEYRQEYRVELTFCALGLCAAHLVMTAVVARRCKEDLNLRIALLAIGLFFLTIAIPLYLEMHARAMAMAWAVEGVILMVIGLRYRSICTQVGGVVAILLSFGQLLEQLPMHNRAFDLVFNPAFGTWCFVVGALLVCYLVYRMNSTLAEDLRRLITGVLYVVALLLLMAAVVMEWSCHCDYNLVNIVANPDNYFLKGMVIIFAAFLLLFIIRPICPRGTLCKILATILAGVGAVFTMVVFTEFYKSSFRIFANVEFGRVAIFVAALFAAAALLRMEREKDQSAPKLATAFALAGIFVLWVLLTEEIYLYWYCRDRFAERIVNWRFLSHMYISIMWAVYGAVLMIVGFWRKSGMLRYIALGLFALLLAKVFIWDTRTVKSVYRIAAFLATGVTLVGVSYLYQFLKKKGFFEAMLAEKNLSK